MFASCVLLSVGQSWHIQSPSSWLQLKMYWHQVCKLQTPARKSRCAGLCPVNCMYRTVLSRKQVRLLIQDRSPSEERKEGNTKTSVQCSNQHFVQLPLKVELAVLIVSLRWHEIATAKLMFPPHLKVFMIILYSFEVFPATFLLLHLHKMSSLKWKANDSCIFWYLWPA